MQSLRRLARYLPRGEFFRSALTIAAGTGAAQLIVIGSAPVLTRLYEPAHYGVFAVVSATLGILVSVTCLRYEFAIPIPKDDVTAANLLGLSLLAALAVSVLVGSLLWVIGPALLSLFGASSLGPYVLLLALAQLGGGVTSALGTWAIRMKDFSQIARNRLTHSGSLVGVQITLGLVGGGALGLVLGSVASNVAGSIQLARAAWRRSATAFRGVSAAGMLATAKRYRRFPIVTIWSGLLGAVGVRAPLLLLAAFYGPDIGGKYALAERLCYLPVTLVATSVGQVVVAETARIVRERSGSLETLFRDTTWSLVRVAIGPAVLIGVAAPLLAGWAFGDQWRDTGLIVTLLVPMFFMGFVTSSTGDIVLVLERQGLHMTREVLRFALLGGSICLAAAAQLPPLWTVAILSAAGFVTYALYGYLTWRAIAHYQPHTPSDGVIDTIKADLSAASPHE